MNLSFFRGFSAKSYWFGLFCFGQFFISGSILAQSHTVSAEEELIQVSFRVYLWPEVSDISNYIGEEGYSYVAPKISYQESSDGAIRLIDAQDRRISDSYRYSGEGPLVFFNEVPNAAEDVSLRVPLGSVAADQLVGGDLLLIFFPNKSKEGLAYNILPVEAPNRRIPDGQAMFYNLTKETLAIYTGKRPQTLEPRTLTLMDLGREEDDLVPLRIMVKAHTKNEWVMRHTERQRIRDDEKLLFFVYPRDEKSNRIRLLSINAAM